MTWVQGLFGWLSLGLVAAACDDTQDTCRRVVVKYQECEDKIVEEKLKALPDLFKQQAVDITQRKVKEQNAAAVEDLRKQCEVGKFTDTERGLFRYWRQCITKPCVDYLACISAAQDAGPP